MKNFEDQIRSRPMKRRAAIMVAAAASLMVFTACLPKALGNGTPNGAVITPAGKTPAYKRAVITYDTVDGNGAARNDDYNVDPNGSLAVYAPLANKGGNFREALIRTDAPVSTDQQSCVTWHGVTKPGPLTADAKKAVSDIQPGVVLRARTDGDRTRAIMVTNNIAFGIRSTLNVHLVDTTGTKPYEQIAQLPYMDTIGSVRSTPLPWRFCARIEGNTLTAKAWSTRQAEPAWDDPKNAISTDIRFVYKNGAVTGASGGTKFDYSGQPGIFVGHLKRGEQTKFTSHTTSTIN